MTLVLSVFPGLGLLDSAFEREGFCVVRGPDILWGGDIRRFHPPRGSFDGVIGGPPCQSHSVLAHLARSQGYRVAEDLIPEFVRVVTDAEPVWFLRENVPKAPVPTIEGYDQQVLVWDNRWLGEVQRRRRQFIWGRRQGAGIAKITLPDVGLEAIDAAPCVTAQGTVWDRRRGGPKVNVSRETLRESLVLQGLPADYLDHTPLTVKGAMRMVGNGVPLPLGRAVARAIREVLAKTDERLPLNDQRKGL